MSATAHSATSAVRRPFRALRFTRDEELVRLLRAGDERAFEAMYDRHHRGILAFCRHMLGSAEEAEDAVQHTFIAAHRDLVGTDKPIQLKAWLYTIARNRCLSLLRARREERALDDVPEPSVEGLASAVQRRQDLRDLLADLQRLPEEQRAALVLSELGALSHEEIGTTLGVRKDKVKALVFQARESLASSRTARDADCRKIQEQLAVLRGGSLRRTTLRRHVEVCPACAAFKAEVKRQRGAMAAILPVVPSLALKQGVLAAAFGGGGAAGGGGILGGTLLAASGTKGLVAKVATIAVVAGGATGGGLKAVDDISSGGSGSTATAMAGVPAEKRAMKMVGALRDHAERTADERAADRRSARLRPASLPGGEASTRGRAEIVAPRPRPRTTSHARAERPERDRSRAKIERATRRTGTPVSAPAPAAPPPQAAPPAAPAPQAGPKSRERDKSGDDDKRERDDDKRGKKKKRGTRRGAGIDPQPGHKPDGEREHRGEREDDDERPEAPPVEIPAQQAPPEAPRRHDRGRHRHKGDRGRRDRPRRDRGPRAPVPAPAPPQVPQPALPGQDARPERGGLPGRGSGDHRRKDRKRGYVALPQLG